MKASGNSKLKTCQASQSLRCFKVLCGWSKQARQGMPDLFTMDFGLPCLAARGSCHTIAAYCSVAMTRVINGSHAHDADSTPMSSATSNIKAPGALGCKDHSAVYKTCTCAVFRLAMATVTTDQHDHARGMLHIYMCCSLLRSKAGLRGCSNVAIV